MLAVGHGHVGLVDVLAPATAVQGALEARHHTGFTALGMASEAPAQVAAVMVGALVQAGSDVNGMQVLPCVCIGIPPSSRFEECPHPPVPGRPLFTHALGVLEKKRGAGYVTAGWWPWATSV
jgi:hypothetical protein